MYSERARISRALISCQYFLREERERERVNTILTYFCGNSKSFQRQLLHNMKTVISFSFCCCRLILFFSFFFFLHFFIFFFSIFILFYFFIFFFFICVITSADFVSWHYTFTISLKQFKKKKMNGEILFHSKRGTIKK